MFHRPNSRILAGSQSVWYVLKSNFNFGFFFRTQWGLSTDKPVPADYDGNAKTGIAVWSPSDGTWHIIRSGVMASPNMYFQWGINGDIPQPADYDGDKRADFAVFRPNADPSQNYWYIFRSSDSTLSTPEWGQPGDVPATAAYRIQ